jgi:hypothetical protein
MTITPMQIIAACDAGPGAMVAIGLPAPKNYWDVIQKMWAAQDRLPPAAARALAVRDRMTLDYVYSATKVPGAFPAMRGLPFPGGSGA